MHHEINQGNSAIEKGYGQNHTKRINEVNIIINDGNTTLSSNCLNDSRMLVGSFLIQVSNCSVYMNGEEYVNLDTTLPTQSFSPTTGLKVNVTKIIDRIPLEYLQTFQHRETLQKLNLTTENIQVRLSFGSISTTTIVFIGVIFVWLFRGTILRTYDAQKEEMVRPESRKELSRTREPRKPRLIPQQ